MVIFVGIVFLLCVSLKMKISKFNQLTLDDDIIYHTFYSNGEIKEVLVLSLYLRSVVLRQLHDFFGYDPDFTGQHSQLMWRNTAENVYDAELLRNQLQKLNHTCHT